MSKLAVNGGTKVIQEDFESLFHWPIVTSEDIQAVTEVLEAGTMSGNEISKIFEQEYAAWNGTKYALSTANGTAALTAAFWACGIGAGDEVICPSMTYWASCTAIVKLGATVNFADIDEELNIDPDDIEHRIGPRTKAIIVVNYGAQPAKWQQIRAIADKHHLLIIEDNSHAQGALYQGKMCGALGDISCASLMSGKSLAIGEGGMICTDNRELFERCVAYGFYERTGVASKFNKAESFITDPALQKYAGIPIGGVKYRINQTCAAMGRVQLKYYDERVAEIDKAMNYFCDLIDELPGLKTIRPAKGTNTTKGGWYAAKGLVSEELAQKISAEKFCAAVAAEGVFTFSGANPPLHLSPLFHDLDYFNQGKPTVIAFGQRDVRQGKGSLPMSESLPARCFHLPWFKHFDKPAIEAHAAAFRKVIENIDELI
ncbi:MAG: DegT/DnrJ/EryC1/StrS family aminotransferase [Lentisphaerae bacterium]|nr:DegT/DnrJ/EryC1/StrS family aminotransferase [Lentisphaerota bacterium]